MKQTQLIEAKIKQKFQDLDTQLDTLNGKTFELRKDIHEMNENLIKNDATV